MIVSLLDWVSPNAGLHRLNAPPETDDYHPLHAPLTSVDDLKKIFGWAEFTSKPGWDEDFATIPSPCTQIDLAWASRDVLRALGIGDNLVDRFLQLRRGPDGIDGTADDAQFNDLNDALTRGIGLNPQQIQQTPALAQGLAIFKGTVFRIVSMGRSGDVTRSVEMVVQKPAGGVGDPRMISWKEL
jgi:hypothetical protein